MEFKVNYGIWGNIFGVPCIVADNFLKLATGKQIKVLLYLLRCSGNVCTDEEIAINTGVSPQEASDAVLFWQQANILSPQNVTQDPAAVQSIMVQPSAINSDKPVIEDNASSKISASKQKTNYSGSQIADIMKNSGDISELFKIAESSLGTLSNSQMNSIIWMYDYLGLKKEVIVILMSYCVRIEKTNSAYMESIARSWAENDINDFNTATDEVQRLTESRNFVNMIMKSFEMNRRPTAKQLEYIDSWRRAGFNIEIIHYAYEKTIERIDKLNFDYINKILSSWRDSGFKNVKDVQNAENDFRKKKKSAAKNSSDEPDIEKYKVVINKF